MAKENKIEKSKRLRVTLVDTGKKFRIYSVVDPKTLREHSVMLSVRCDCTADAHGWNTKKPFCSHTIKVMKEILRLEERNDKQEI